MNIDQLPKHTTTESLRAELNRRKPYTDAIGAAMRAGNIAEMFAVQDAMHRMFPESTYKGMQS